ncbi:hypothetical protein N0V93_002565 [Gnomoniopsis smithogilvyi]|uniref:G-patch domain-containing protein n=1 Tax=Gnomoniopsis smithogilvyi TaxID=1191159 RepID=A0A9W9CZ42_9PEZI|nr:hypothetical protein N0V93_002565 [Gnomoniopsis smithogilvyi]
MSAKRSRATYEADLQAQQSPFVVYGTPLPPYDPDSRDDGSYVPVWKQEVRDERGRKRLHGAFTGGWSAGYFNTVGSEEGWTPSTFVSSRSSRHKDTKLAAAPQQRPEDFMDEEDLADAEESRKIETSNAFAGLGTTGYDAGAAGGLAGLFRVQGETMGTKLLKKMGWREGQGIGPKVRRRADLGMAASTNSDDTYLFAPENAPIIGFIRKADRKGLGYEGSQRLAPLATSQSRQRTQSEDEDADEDLFSLGKPRFAGPRVSKKKSEDKSRGSGIGMGVLNDTGSDDEDPYEIGPRISYNKVIGGNKSKKKKDIGPSTSVNPALKTKPVFLPKRITTGQSTPGPRKCHDGRPPLDGFVLGEHPDPLISFINFDRKYLPPEIPAGWKSSKKPEATSKSSDYVSTADAAKASQLNPIARAALLGEEQLPGKSVFDFLSPAARDRLAAVTGKENLPQAKGEIPEGYALSEVEKKRSLLERIPKLDNQSALGAMARGASGGGPYSDNEEKRARYRSYLELQAGLRTELPEKLVKMNNDEWIQEMNEFYNVARIFRPMTGSMASRFTTSKAPTEMATGSDGKVGEDGLISKPVGKPEDPAEAAAKMGMYGQMTRSIRDFYPSRLLCKRFNVKPPAHVQLDSDANVRDAQRPGPEPLGVVFGGLSEASEPKDAPKAQGVSPGTQKEQALVVDTNRNEALEGKRAGEEVFKAIFGDSSDDDS